MLFNIFLVADTCNKVHFLIGEEFSALFKQVGMPNVEGVKDTISVDSENFLVLHGKYFISSY